MYNIYINNIQSLSKHCHTLYNVLANRAFCIGTSPATHLVNLSIQGDCIKPIKDTHCGKANQNAITPSLYHGRLLFQELIWFIQRLNNSLTLISLRSMLFDIRYR